MRGENGTTATDRGLTVAGCILNTFVHNLSFQPDSAIPPGGIAVRPWHRPEANLRRVLLGVRRSFLVLNPLHQLQLQR
jgi:hypothetical protein